MGFENPFEKPPAEKKPEYRTCPECRGNTRDDPHCRRCNGSGKVRDGR